MMDIQGNYRRSFCKRRNHSIKRNIFLGSDNPHRFGNNALTSRLQLRHFFSSAGITLIRFTGFSQHPDTMSGSTPI
jgi:hypothetical protein